MNPYDATRPCAKCGAVGAQTEYVPSSQAGRTTKQNSVPSLTSEPHMRRRCWRCEHVWAEMPLDIAAVDRLNLIDMTVTGCDVSTTGRHQWAPIQPPILSAGLPKVTELCDACGLLR